MDDTIYNKVVTLLSPYREYLGKDATAYTHHVTRMVHYTHAMGSLTEEESEKVLIAGVFHDLGIWTDNTIDYLDPSEKLAIEYLKTLDCTHYENDIITMIRYHHKLLPIKNNPLAERFRKADLVDVSWGFMRANIDTVVIKNMKKNFPNNGFHKRLLELTWQQFKQEPLNPLPMMKL